MEKRMLACVECKARSSSVLEVERLSAENGAPFKQVFITAR
jgi:hypothetical protein